MRYLEETGPGLVRNGYLIIPVPRGTKAPKDRGWQNERNDSEGDVQLLMDLGLGDSNVGVLCGVGETPICLVDIDCTDEHVARAMQDWCERELGPTVERVGKAPKMGLIYRCPEGMGKVVGPRYQDAEGRVHGFEVLAAGQQFIAYGLHPEGMEYRQDGLWGSMLEVPAAELPLAGAKHLTDAVAEWSRLCEADGWTKVGGRAGGERAPRAVNPDDYEMPDPPVTMGLGEVRELLTWLDPEAMDYSGWLSVGQALHHQYAGSDDGLVLWDEWSQRDAGRYDGDAIAGKWAGFGAYHGRQVTLRTYIKEVNRLRAEALRSERVEAIAEAEGWIAGAPDHVVLLAEVAPRLDAVARLYPEDAPRMAPAERALMAEH
ncbi:MAG TPA: PriCT-2 domain-containing protein, partial [Myxococcota bacterium]|nr:PriCT-2 domain-containing protein [Myxococcota bacterium]